MEVPCSEAGEEEEEVLPEGEVVLEEEGADDRLLLEEAEDRCVACVMLCMCVHISQVLADIHSGASLVDLIRSDLLYTIMR